MALARRADAGTEPRPPSATATGASAARLAPATVNTQRQAHGGQRRTRLSTAHRKLTHQLPGGTRWNADTTSHCPRTGSTLDAAVTPDWTEGEAAHGRPHWRVVLSLCPTASASGRCSGGPSSPGSACTGGRCAPGRICGGKPAAQVDVSDGQAGEASRTRTCWSLSVTAGSAWWSRASWPSTLAK